MNESGCSCGHGKRYHTPRCPLSNWQMEQQKFKAKASGKSVEDFGWEHGPDGRIIKTPVVHHDPPQLFGNPFLEFLQPPSNLDRSAAGFFEAVKRRTRGGE